MILISVFEKPLPLNSKGSPADFDIVYFLNFICNDCGSLSLTAFAETLVLKIHDVYTCTSLLGHQPKFFDWEMQAAKPYLWKQVPDSERVCVGVRNVQLDS